MTLKPGRAGPVKMLTSPFLPCAYPSGLGLERKGTQMAPAWLPLELWSSPGAQRTCSQPSGVPCEWRPPSS